MDQHGAEAAALGAGVPVGDKGGAVEGDPSVVAPQAAVSVRTGTALCLSGGGSRAMLFHAGALLRLAETGRLGALDAISSVSGGSIMAGLLARAWVDAGHPPSRDELQGAVLEPLLEVTRHTLDVPSFFRGLLPRTSPGEQFARRLDELLLKGLTLGQLPDTPEFVFNATNLGTGVLWQFSKGYVGDYVVGGSARPSLRVSTAVAASSAFPPFFAPLRLKGSPGGTAYLGDGGIYDNMGLETAWKRFSTILVSDGGGAFRVDRKTTREPIQLTLRVTNVIDHQVRSLRKRQIVGGLASGQRAGAYWGIRSAVADYPVQSHYQPGPGATTPLADLPTRMAKLDPAVTKRVINWGYVVCDTALRSYVLGADLAEPAWPFPEQAL